MKTIKTLLLALVFSCAPILKSNAGEAIVAGFFPDWVSPSEINDVQFDKLTDVLYAFLYPNSNGNLLPTTNNGLTNTLAPLVTAAHAQGVRVHVSIGGANSSGNFSGVVANASRRQNFVNDLSSIISTYDLDGVDIDWEFPSGADRNNLTLLMQEIRDELDVLEGSMGKKLYLSMAVAPLVWNTDGISSTSIALSDHIYVMAFDAGGNCCVCDASNHSSFLIAQRALSKWTTGLASTCGGTTTGMNTPNEKLVLAIPFYARNGGYAGYDVFSASNPSGYYNDNDGIFGGRDYNSCPLIQQKTELVMDTYGGAGIWTWELTQDRHDQYSLLSCMYDAMTPYLCGAPEPNLGEDVSICGQSSVTLNSGVSTGAGRTFTWRRNGVLQISNNSATTFDANSAGTYTVEVSEGGCSNTDEIIVTGTLPAISLGEDIDLCSPTTTILDAGIDPAGKSFSWTRNGSGLSGETSSTLNVSEAGTYEVTVSATGCSNVTDQIVVTSSLPSVTHDTLCVEGNADLSASTNVDWYDVSTGGTAVSSGSSYSPYISANTTYYVEASGAANQETTTMKTGLSGGWQANQNVYATQFTVHSDLQLKSVDVNANNGNVVINVVEDDGTTVVATKTFNNVSGMTTLLLEFDLSPGTYFLNAVGSSTTIYVDPVEVSDFDIAGIITVGGTAYNDWSEPYGNGYVLSENYGNFANLVVLSGSACDRVPVYAIIDDQRQECLITSTEETLNEELFSVFPNPTSNQFTISSSENLVLELFDVSGKKIETFQVNGQHSFGNELESGVYFIQTSDKQLRTRIIKK
jgi:GH18 family chitinase